MSNFKLDKSGSVRGRNDGSLMRAAGKRFEDSQVRWDDLSPFVQGYVEALFAHCYDRQSAQRGGYNCVADEADYGPGAPLGFADLAPETLARIIEDCRIASELPCYRQTPSQTYAGRVFWLERQSGFPPNFPPITVYLGDDGKVWFQ